MENQKALSVLKVWGVLLILLGLVYALLGSLALAGTVTGVLPGHENQEILVVVLAYAVAVLAFIAGIACIKGARTFSMVMGIILTVIGAVSLIYVQVTQQSFSYFDILAVLLGISMFFMAKQIKEN